MLMDIELVTNFLLLIFYICLLVNMSKIYSKIEIYSRIYSCDPQDWVTSIFDFIQFSSVAQSCLTLCNPMDCSVPGFPVHHQLPELAQTHVHQVSDAIQPSHPLSSPSPPAFNLSQHQDLFQGVSSSHQVAKVLELQLPMNI